MDAAPAVTSLEAPPVSTRATVHRLGNGLTVLVEPRHEVPVVALNVTYVVGSRHESAGRRGIAHLFEHLMFQGSAHVAPGEHAAILEGLGAAFNATTSFDRTWYYETVPVHALETALWLEADRMATLPQALSQTELDAQREVVGNERLQTMVNVPYGELMAHVLELALPQESPYALLPIGRMEELAEATIADLAAFFASAYSPANAVLAIVGDVEPERALALAHRYFGSIPGIEPAAHAEVATLGPIPAGVRETVHQDVPHRMVTLAWRAPRLDAPGYAALDVLRLILGAGAASRLETRLVRERSTALGASVFLEGTREGNSLFVVNLVLAPDADPDEALAQVEGIITEIAEHGPTAAELDAALVRIERFEIESEETAAGRADALARAQAFFGEPDHPLRVAQERRRLTPQDLAQAARTWLVPGAHATVTYEPTPASDSAPRETDR